MALTVYDRVKETTTTTGTGTYSLAGAATCFQAFSDVFATGDTTYYCAEDGTDWEVGLGTLTSGAPWTLARTSILASSNADAAVNWAAGTRNIFCTLPASVATGFGVAGSDTQVMFNDGGAFGGDSGFTFDKTNNALTLGGATVTTSQPVLDLSQTWNAAGVTFTGIKANFTSTASAAASTLMTLQVGGVNKFQVAKDGRIYFGDVGILFGSIGPNNNGVTLYSQQGEALISAGDNGQSSYRGVGIRSNAPLGWSSTTTPNAGSDTLLWRDAANTLALRNSTNAQEFRVFGTYTSATQQHYCAVKTAKTTLTATAGATITATNLIPAGAFLIGVTTRVNTTCTTATGYTVGDGSDADLWGVAAAVAAGTATSAANYTAAAASGLYIAAQSVVITATGGNFDGTGAIEVVAHYLTTFAD